MFLPVRCASRHILVPMSSSNWEMSFFAAASLMSFDNCSYCYSIFFASRLIKMCTWKKVSVTKFGGPTGTYHPSSPSRLDPLKASVVTPVNEMLSEPAAN